MLYPQFMGFRGNFGTNLIFIIKCVNSITWIALFSLSLSACGSLFKRSDTVEAPVDTASTTVEVDQNLDPNTSEVHHRNPQPIEVGSDALIKTLSQKVDLLEERLSMVNEKVNTIEITKNEFSKSNSKNKKNERAVIAHPADTAVDLGAENSNEEFIDNASLEKFKTALLLMHSEKYPEAILAFNTFIQNYSNHVLAGSAQYYIGECYFLLKEYKLATDEFKRMLIAFEDNSHIPDALKRLVETSKENPSAEEKYKQELFSFYAQSPAAKELLEQGNNNTE